MITLKLLHIRNDIVRTSVFSHSNCNLDFPRSDCNLEFNNYHNHIAIACMYPIIEGCLTVEAVRPGP